MQHHHDLFRGGDHKPMPARLEQDFPAAKLAVCWRCLPVDVDRYAEERGLIRTYTDAFGASSPLNAMP